VAGIAGDIATRVPEQPAEPASESQSAAPALAEGMESPAPATAAAPSVTAAQPTPAPVGAPSIKQAPPPAPAALQPVPPPVPEPEPISWHYLLQGQPQGPVAEDDLRGWLAEGRLPADTMVWNPTLTEWQPARDAGLTPPEPARRFCGQCGAQVAPEARFCGGCGNTLG